jgi:hypothetical protein
MKYGISGGSNQERERERVDLNWELNTSKGTGYEFPRLAE